MNVWLTLSALLFLGIAHSVLGELVILRPLFRDDRWRLGLSRKAAQRVMRFAWHLTSVAWLGLAAVFYGVPAAIAVGVTCLISGAVIFFSLRSHLAWPVFFFAGLTSLQSAGALPALVIDALLASSIAVAMGAALLHVYWAMGGRAGNIVVIPSRPDGTPMFEPGPVACLAVAALLGTFAALVHAASRPDSPLFVRVLLGLALFVLVLRAVGDGKQIGFSKRDRSTPFARADDAIFTPLVVVLAFGAVGGLLPV